jgi:hypothetical protein
VEDAQTLRRWPPGQRRPLLSASCAGADGALGCSPESRQPDNGSSRLSTSPAAERLLSGRRRRLLSGGRRPAGLRLRAAAGGGSSPAGERRARERGRGSGGRRGPGDVLRAVRVRGLGQPFYGPIRPN